MADATASGEVKFEVLRTEESVKVTDPKDEDADHLLFKSPVATTNKKRGAKARAIHCSNNQQSSEQAHAKMGKPRPLKESATKKYSEYLKKTAAATGYEAQ